MKQFEYKIVSLDTRESLRDLIDPLTSARVELEGLGKEGYELVLIIDNIAYLKKEVMELTIVAEEKGE